MESGAVQSEDGCEFALILHTGDTPVQRAQFAGRLGLILAELARC